MQPTTEQQTLDDLQAKLAEHTRREIEIRTESDRLALSALSGDASARKRLDALNREYAGLEVEGRNFKAAIEEARRRVTEAERGKELELLREKAVGASALGASMVDRARKIDAALAIVAAESVGFQADIGALNQLGVANPRAQQFTVLGEQAFLTAVMQSPLKVRHLAPTERRTFTEIATGWRTMIDRWASTFLKNEEAA